jgi:hypothetical protein
MDAFCPKDPLANILLAFDKRSDKHITIVEIDETYHTTPTTVQIV